MFHSNYFNKRVVLDVGIHLAIFIISYVSAFALIFLGDLGPQTTHYLFITIPAMLLVKVLVFSLFRAFSGQWQDASVPDIVALGKANLVSSLTIALLYYFYLKNAITFNVFVADLMITTLLTGFNRFSVRLYNELIYKKSIKVKRVLVVGAGIMARRLLKELKSNWEMGINPVAIVDDDPQKLGHTVMGVKILGNRKSILHLAETMNIDEIIIAFSYARGEDMRELAKICRLAGKPFRIISKPEGGTMDQKAIVDRIRKIKIEDLIGREQIQINFDQVQKYIEGKRVLVTGAAGSIGSEICRQIAKFNPEKLVAFDRSENGLFYLDRELSEKYQELDYSLALADITDFIETDNVFSKHKPQLVFHAAAYKHVPMMELHPSQAVKNNVMGTKNVLDVCIQHHVKKFVFISTDKAVNPTSFMGMTKRIAEQVVQASDNTNSTRCMAVRFGNVIGSSGSVIRLFEEQITKGGPVTVTHPDVKRYFMSIPEAVQLVLQAAVLGDGGQIFLLKMGELIKINEIAKELIMLAGNGSADKINISYTGLRFGEKIIEELWENEEELMESESENLYILKRRSTNRFNLREFKGKINNIIRIASTQEKNLNGFKNKLEEIIEEGRSIMR